MLTIQTPTGLLKGETLADIIKKHGKDCLSGANLRYADLSYTSLNCADLRYADLRYADLRYADLTLADLRYAVLSNADLSRADLSYADLRYAVLSNADLSHANLRYADLSNADLRYADLSHARSVPPAVIDLTTILPDEGTIIGWKKAMDEYYNSVIVKLLIPANARRSNATGRKCRTSEAEVLDIQNLGGESLDGVTAHSNHDKDFLYRKGETVHVDDFDPNRWNECAPGIHFFITRWEAVHY